MTIAAWPAAPSWLMGATLIGASLLLLDRRVARGFYQSRSAPLFALFATTWMAGGLQ